MNQNSNIYLVDWNGYNTFNYKKDNEEVPKNYFHYFLGSFGEAHTQPEVDMRA